MKPARSVEMKECRIKENGKKGDSKKKSMSRFCDISCENRLIKILRSYCNIGLIKKRYKLVNS